MGAKRKALKKLIPQDSSALSASGPYDALSSRKVKLHETI